MATPPPLHPRHYDRPALLVSRTYSDVEPDVHVSRARALPFTEAMRPRPARPKLIATAEGAIARMLLTIPAYAVASPPLAAVYGDLLGKLPAPVELVVLTHQSAAADVRGWLARAGRTDRSTVVEAPDHLNFSIWAEDGYVAAANEEDGVTYLVEPFSFPRYGDSLVADLVANATDLDKTQAPLYFQGGNVLIGGDFFLIGADYPAESLHYVGGVLVPKQGEGPADLVKRLYGEYLDPLRRMIPVASTVAVPTERQRKFELDGQQWTETIYSGNKKGTVQPVFHIDMFITPLGSRRLLVGDPRMAAEVLGMPLQPHAMAEVFDDIARGLTRLGFEVTRNPLPLVYADDPDAKERNWYFATSNNALVQVPASGQTTVIVPTYGHGAWASLEATDRRNREIYEGLGFQVTALGDFHPFAENLGALHCIKKYLGRA